MRMWFLLLASLLLSGSATTASAQDGFCGCSNQKTDARGPTGCTRVDGVNLCTIRFGQIAGNVTVSNYLRSNGLIVPSLGAPGSSAGAFSDPVNLALQVLSLPKETLQRQAAERPVEFSGSLYLALAAAIAAPRGGEVPRSIPGALPQGMPEVPVLDVLGPLSSLMLKNYSGEISKGFFSTELRTVEDGRFTLMVREGCFEVVYRGVDILVKAVWSTTPRNDCRG